MKNVKKLVRKTKIFLRFLIGKEIILKPDIFIKKEKFGSDYGGYEVAIDYINSNSIVYSFGIGEDLSFEMSLIKKYNLVVHAFDPTPKSINWVNKQVLPKNLIIHEYGLGALDGEMIFYPPENPDHVSYSTLRKSYQKIERQVIKLPVKTLGTIMTQLDHKQVDILKMDIEGTEYDVIDYIYYTQIPRPSQILVEFHHRFKEIGINKTIDAIAKLRSIG